MLTNIEEIFALELSVIRMLILFAVRFSDSNYRRSLFALVKNTYCRLRSADGLKLLAQFIDCNMRLSFPNILI